MKHAKRRRWIAILSLVTVLTLGIVISLLVLGSPELDFTATAYSDLVRFQAEGVATLQVRIFDLSGREVWDSGVVSGDIVDWDRNNEWGERLAYGVYLYSAQGWNASGDLIFQKNGKLALMPGDKVQLQAAPGVSLPRTNGDLPPFRDEAFTFQPMAVDVDHSTESWAFAQVGIGTTSPDAKLQVNGGMVKVVSDGTKFALYENDVSGVDSFFTLDNGTHAPGIFVPVVWMKGNKIGSSYANAFIADVASDTVTDTGPVLSFMARANNGPVSNRPLFWFDNHYNNPAMVILASGNIGVGIKIPTATLEVHGSATNLLALYDPVAPTDPKFRVTKTGEVRADGAYYSGTGGFHTGYADVAERINTSEWVEPGCVVEIDSEHPGFFRKSSTPYSTKVAGVISTSPGVILGNSFDEATDDWEDNRPVLAIAGRVPLQVTTENGPIQIGDLLVSSSTPGIAMKGDPEKAMGAVIGKAMEPLEDGEGTIVVQVMLR